jgi:hypothetical protein
MDRNRIRGKSNGVLNYGFVKQEVAEREDLADRPEQRAQQVH